MSKGRGWFGNGEAHAAAGRMGGIARHKYPKGFAAMTKEEVQKIARQPRKRLR